MRLIDVNLLIYAENPASPFHTRAKQWWEALLSTGEPVCLTWVSLIAYLRLTTNPKLIKPASSEEAASRLEEILAQPSVSVIVPGENHWEIYSGLVRKYSLCGNSLTDAHLVALAIEYQLEINTADQGFKRYTEIVARNPVEELSI